MIWLSIPVLGLAAVFEATFMPQIRIFDGQPDLVLLIVLAWAVRAPFRSSMGWAIIGGLMQDLLSAAPLGTSVLGFVVLVYALDRLRTQVVRTGLLTYIGLVLVGSFVIKVIALAVIALSGYAIQPVEAFTSNILPSAAYNLAFMLPVYWIVRFIQRRAGIDEDARTGRERALSLDL